MITYYSHAAISMSWQHCRALPLQRHLLLLALQERPESPVWSPRTIHQPLIPSQNALLTTFQIPHSPPVISLKLSLELLHVMQIWSMRLKSWLILACQMAGEFLLTL